MAEFGDRDTCIQRQLCKDESAFVYIGSPSLFQSVASQALLIYTWGDREARTDNNEEEL